MEIRELVEKKKYALDFYEQAVEINNMVHDSIRGFHYLYGFDFYTERTVNNDELKKMIEKRRRQLLIELGRVGEYSIKYLLLMQQIYNYPNQSFEEFKNKTLYSIGEKGVRNTYINQYHMDYHVIKEILAEKEQHKLQPLHDYTYLFTILEKLYPSVVNCIKENMLFNAKYSYNYETSSLPKDLIELTSFFPSIKFLDSLELSNEVRNSYVEEYKRILENSGDSFTRLRYLENNPDNKDYNMGEIMQLLDELVDFINLTHNFNNDNPEENIRIAYIKKRISEVILPQGLRKYDEHPKFKEKLHIAENLCKSIYDVLDIHPEIIETIDYSQLAIWKRFNHSESIYSDAISNFINNLATFKDNEKLLSSNFPLLLPKEHILTVLDFLENVGIDYSTIEKKDTSILCVPIEYLKRAYECISQKDISAKTLISGVNRTLYEEGMNKCSVPELPLRHR